MLELQTFFMNLKDANLQVIGRTWENYSMQLENFKNSKSQYFLVGQTSMYINISDLKSLGNIAPLLA